MLPQRGTHLRWGAPSRSVYGRGSRAAGLAIAGNSRALASEVEALREVEYAHTSKGPHASRLKTVELFGARIGSAYPLSVDMVYDLAACMRRAGYRATFAYLTRAVQEHRLRDHPIGPAVT